MKNSLLTIQGVQIAISPQDGENFTLDELYSIIGCEFIEAVTLSPVLSMLIDEYGIMNEKPFNQLATLVLYQYHEIHRQRGTRILGNAAVVHLDNMN